MITFLSCPVPIVGTEFSKAIGYFLGLLQSLHAIVTIVELDEK